MGLKELSRQLGVSPPTVRARIRRLVEYGVIKRFTITIDPRRLGDQVQALIILSVLPEALEKAMKRLASKEEVQALYLTAGEGQLVVRIVAPGLSELPEVMKRVLQGVDGVQSYRTLIMARVVKEEEGVSIKEGVTLNLVCDFCGAPIAVKPLIKYIEGGRYYFCSEKCYEAYLKGVKR
jgi:Lrp/AsnC family transcriptional regulator for asnA, asnC and gidA